MDLSSLKPAPGSVKTNTRLGRGTGSGKGGTSGRGHKGAKSRSGYSSKKGFEGGQMPLQRRIPKFGFKNINRIEYRAVNLDVLQTLLSAQSVDVVDPDYMLKHGLISKKDLVKVLGRGEFTSAVEIKAHSFSASSIAAIEKAGGKAIVINKA
jgi:large subunit ribosomal protein L15